jgi:hypothetical protein
MDDIQLLTEHFIKGHTDCRGCHQEQNKARGTEKAPTKCDGCHTGAQQ